MDQYLANICKKPFNQLPSEVQCTAFGVDYGHIRAADGGDLYVTRYGWPYLRQLLPENWYAEGWYSQKGERLSGSTGNVYRVPTKPVHGKSIDLVVKFSRVGREVLLEVATTFPDNITPEEIANAWFNSPQEEFGLVMEMRRGMYGPKNIRLMAQRPLAIYAPPEEIEFWKTGRIQFRFDAHQQLLAKDQTKLDKAIELDIKRRYVLLYNWIKGMDAEEAFEIGDISERELHELTIRVIEELRIKGFRVLDNKTKHFIVRRHLRNEKILRRKGQVVYGLVDYELLQRTKEYQRQFKYIQRKKYWQMLNHRMEQWPLAMLPPHLKHVRIWGVNYIFGIPPSGGKLWVVGNEPGLFDFFLPSRWRRTPRLKLSPTNEVYRTRTRDNIHVVYRRSRVGEQPQFDVSHQQLNRIRQHGYNSPFEEVAIAEGLRRVGIPTTYPRAIYRTEHRSTKSSYIFDERHYVTHASLMMPEPESGPILVPDYDYYTIWSHFRGIDPDKYYQYHGHWGLPDVEKAYETELITEDEYHHVVQFTHRRLKAIGIAGENINNHELLLSLNNDETLCRDAHGELEVTLSIDALSAHKHKVIDEGVYRDVIKAMEARLQANGCERLNLSGNHLLLSMNPDGKLKTGERGELEIMLCNFDLIRVPDSILS
ncbi:MAG: hypothetical protein ACYTF1_13290 [Planctomycetota bacterium]|jgi:hypothetical protein